MIVGCTGLPLPSAGPWGAEERPGGPGPPSGALAQAPWPCGAAAAGRRVIGRCVRTCSGAAGLPGLPSLCSSPSSGLTGHGTPRAKGGPGGAQGALLGLQRGAQVGADVRHRRRSDRTGSRSRSRTAPKRPSSLHGLAGEPAPVPPREPLGLPPVGGHGLSPTAATFSLTHTHPRDRGCRVHVPASAGGRPSAGNEGVVLPDRAGSAAGHPRAWRPASSTENTGGTRRRPLRFIAKRRLSRRSPCI